MKLQKNIMVHFFKFEIEIKHFWEYAGDSLTLRLYKY
jgi:hypothetical protein